MAEVTPFTYPISVAVVVAAVIRPDPSLTRARLVVVAARALLDLGVDAGLVGDHPDLEVGAEEVLELDDDGLELAGGTWEGTIYINGGSKTWMASNGWFGGMIKTETDGTTGIVLSSFGEDAEPLLAWE